MSIYAESQLLEPSGIIILFELDCTEIGGDILRFHGYDRDGDIIWQGETYKFWPISAEGFAITGEVQQPNPTLSVGNTNGAIGVLCHALNDLVGAKLTRRRTMVKYLDAVNFPEGNPSADPDSLYPDDIWYVEQKSSQGKDVVTFMMKSALDLSDTFLPRRLIVANTCAWQYRSAECGYTGPAVADEKDVATSDPSKDRCGKRVSSCKLRYGTGVLPFGGFPGALLNR